MLYSEFSIITRLAGVAQSVEQLICNQPVGGSIPFASSKILKTYKSFHHRRFWLVERTYLR